MRTRIVRIGNSKAIRLPKALLQQTGLGDEVLLMVKGNSLLIQPADQPRAGWADAFRQAAPGETDPPIFTPPTEFEDTEWEWD